MLPLPGHVHVWSIDLDGYRGQAGRLLDVLSGEERAAAARMRTTELRLRSIVGHAARRLILSLYAGEPADRLAFERGPAGKPALQGSGAAFNFSHSAGVAVCAIAGGGRIGVDVEWLKRIDDAEGIVRRYFAPGEVRAYLALPAHDRPAAFVSAWTRKEAFIKGLGEGLGRPLDSFEVEIAPALAAPRLCAPPGLGAWHLRSFEAAPGYAGAVAADFPIAALELFDFDAEAADPAAQHRCTSI